MSYAWPSRRWKLPRSAFTVPVACLAFFLLPFTQDPYPTLAQDLGSQKYHFRQRFRSDLQEGIEPLERAGAFLDQISASGDAALASVGAPSIVRGKDGKDMVLIPAGRFLMGCNERADTQCTEHEKPGEEILLDAFCIDRPEVTAADYRKCAEAGSCSTAATGEDCNWGNSGRGGHSINCVDWYQARIYCQAWAGGRLPTEAEWEKAARGTDERVYPRGNRWDGSKANVDSGGTTPVGSYPSGANGLHDMSGNIEEWTSSIFRPYRYEADDGRENPKAGGFRVGRGGSWMDAAKYARTSSRHRGVPSGNGRGVGFRCAKTP